MHHVLKLKQKDDFTWHIKQGQKIKYKIMKVSYGYAVSIRVFDTLEQAINFAAYMVEATYNAFGKTDTVEIVNG